MVRMILAAGAILALAACAGLSDYEAPAATAPPPPAARAQEQAPPADAPGAAPGVVAPGVQAPPAPRAAPPRGDIVVPGAVERQVTPPSGDPRSAAERATDIRNWDRCVMQAQNMGEADPTRPVLDSPEELCSRELGMANRTAVPNGSRP